MSYKIATLLKRLWKRHRGATYKKYEISNFQPGARAMKHQMLIYTSYAGAAVMFPRVDSTKVKVVWLDLDKTSLDHQNRAYKSAMYLLQEGFIEYAGGQLDIDPQVRELIGTIDVSH